MDDEIRSLLTQILDELRAIRVQTEGLRSELAAGDRQKSVKQKLDEMGR